MPLAGVLLAAKLLSAQILAAAAASDPAFSGIWDNSDDDVYDAIYQPEASPLQDAQAHFSELMRRVRSDGPQRVTEHGRDEIVIIAAEEYHRLTGAPTGEILVVAMRSSPHRDIDLESEVGARAYRSVTCSREWSESSENRSFAVSSTV